jgi:hypothetical protein
MPSDKPSSGFISPGALDGSPAAAVTQNGIFRREGEYWTIGLNGDALRLKDSKGLAYIAYLLRHPAADFHALYLIGGIASRSEAPAWDRLALDHENLEKSGMRIGNLGDAGELLDDQAESAYRHRLSELREELEEAKAFGKVERAGELEEEIDALTRELARAVGVGERKRRAASAAERARQTVTKAIKAVIKRIVRSNAVLGDIFSRCIKTGTFCSYQPDPQIRWEFTATNVEPPQPPATNAKAALPGRDYVQYSCGIIGVLPFSMAPRTRFVDREYESSVIRAAIDRADHHGGSLVMLAGEAGMGKTRLTIEMADYARHKGFASFVGRCFERDEPFPYLPFVQIIETMLAQAPSPDEFRSQIGDTAPELAQLVPSLRKTWPDIPQPMKLPEPQMRRFFFQSVAEALGCASRIRPHLLILDDLHWADESALELLTHLANPIAQLPLVIIATYRDEYSENNPALARTLEELIRQGLRPLKLSGLSKDSVAEMLNEQSHRQIPEGVVNAIFEESGGNPFFVEEVYQHLVEEGRIFDGAGRFRAELKIDEIDVPENVRLIIRRRLKRFSDAEMRALSAAAVIGRSFSFQLLSSTSQIDVDELFTTIDKAQRMRIIVSSSEGPGKQKPFTFAHELVRQTLLADISAARRQQLHFRVASEIERLHPAANNAHAGAIAEHLLKAGSFADRDTLLRSLVHAGDGSL